MMRAFQTSLAVIGTVLLTPALCFAVTRRVGPGEMYVTIASAATASADGDIIEIAAGTYREEVVWSRNQLTVRSMGGTVLMDRTGMPLTAQGGKGIFIVDGSDFTVEGIEFQGAVAPSGSNGAGIRWQGGGTLTVRNCVFRDNENGILGGNVPTANAVIEQSEFVGNGRGDLGFTHNVYINEIASLTFRGNWSHALVAAGADVGHLLKSRARRNLILYNRLTAEGAHSSYEIQLTGGGEGYIIGNLLQQSMSGQGGNPTMISIGGDGTQYPNSKVFVVNNTLVNDRASGTFVAVLRADIPVRLVNNLFVGPGTLSSGGMVTNTNNYTGNSPGLVDRATYDYHLLANSTVRDQGIDPGSDGAQSLVPTQEYVHPRLLAARATDGMLDLGAHEFGRGAMQDGGTVSMDASIGDAGTPSDVASDTSQGADSTAMQDSGVGVSDGASEPTVRATGCGCRVGTESGRARWSAVALFGVVFAIKRKRRQKQ